MPLVNNIITSLIQQNVCISSYRPTLSVEQHAPLQVQQVQQKKYNHEYK